MVSPAPSEGNLVEIAPQRGVDDDGSAVSKGFDGVANIARYDRHPTCPGDLGHAIDGYLELALEHFIYFFLRMEVLMNGRPQSKIVVRECHARRVKIAPMPAGQALNNTEGTGVDERHAEPPTHPSTQRTIPESQGTRRSRSFRPRTSAEPGTTGRSCDTRQEICPRA